MIYKYGGIYLDTDVELLKSLDPLINESCFLSVEADSGYIATGLGFGAEKGNQAIMLMLSEYENLKFKKRENDIPINCPILNSKPFYDYGFELGIKDILDIRIAKIYPSEYFCPMNYTTGEINLTNKAYSIHHYNASWQSDRQKEIFKASKFCNRHFSGKTRDYVFLIFENFISTKYDLRDKGVKATSLKLIDKFKRNILKR